MNFEPVGWDRPLESLFIPGGPSPATTEYAGFMPIANVLKETASSSEACFRLSKMTSTQQNGPKSMTADGGWTSISSCLVQGEKEDLLRGRARRAIHRNSTYSLEVVSGLPRLVSDTLFSHHMADIIAIDHNRRDGHAGFLADFNCIQRFDACRNSTFGERLKGLTTSFLPRALRLRPVLRSSHAGVE